MKHMSCSHFEACEFLHHNFLRFCTFIVPGAEYTMASTKFCSCVNYAPSDDRLYKRCTLYDTSLK